MTSYDRVRIPRDLWISILIALEQCLEHMENREPLDDARMKQIQEYAQRALRAARPHRVTH